jgi:SAM-dependent methyltransferase
VTLVAWHDVECGSYDADLDLWRMLAGRHAGEDPVLDVGAGTGRVALDLAARGHAVVALDSEADLLEALRVRAQGLPVETVVADAQAFDLGRAFGLVIVPMQTIQLLGDRPAFLRAAHAHLRPGGILAAAIAHPLEPFDADVHGAPDPDRGRVGGTDLVSRPLAIRDEGDRVAIVRQREARDPDGVRTSERDVIHLHRVSPEALAAEGRAAGLEPLPDLHVPATPEYVDSTVVVWRA